MGNPDQELDAEAARPRLPAAAARKQCIRLLTRRDLTVFFDAIPATLLVLNRSRQLIFANHALLRQLGMKNCRALCGKRPGEIFNCAHALTEPGGCGTTAFCRYCGAFRAMVRSYGGKQITENCRIMLAGKGRKPKALDLKITATPMKLHGMNITVFYAQDITHQLRRDALERVFFHDILNTAGAARGYLEILSDPARRADARALTDTALDISTRLVHELQNQRTLLSAERGDLKTAPRRINAADAIKRAAREYDGHPLAGSIAVKADLREAGFDLNADPALLDRVLDNLVKNALEASKAGQTVTLRAARAGGKGLFSVHNESTMPDAAQKQVFHGSFSTKGAGRGLGTYSVRLLTEGYLGGKISFSSSEKEGTSFTVSLPLKPSRKQPCAP